MVHLTRLRWSKIGKFSKVLFIYYRRVFEGFIYLFIIGEESFLRYTIIKSKIKEGTKILECINEEMK